jgi:hypothetical protein
LARWSSDRDIQGRYLRGCREFYSRACAVTGANFRLFPCFRGS